MRIKLIEAKNILPVKEFSVDNLSDVVVLAGPNGVGKTRLINGILNVFKSEEHVQRVNFPQSSIRLVIEATTKSESDSWGKESLDTALLDDARKLPGTLRKRRHRNKSGSSVFQFESDRTIQPIKRYPYTWERSDPWEEMIGGEVSFSPLKDRFEDTLHSLFRKTQSKRDEIARKAEKLLQEGESSMSLDFPDPLIPFKDAFRQLLAPKELLDPDPKDQQLYYTYEEQRFPIDRLSSGEREVVNIVFDFLLRNPSDSIVIFDEPELHLHSELSYKLLQTLQNVGVNNQFIYCTHSPDIIAASLENSVIFLGPPKDTPSNQAILVKKDDETHEALKKLGQSIGIVALGKKIVLIEGEEASLDKQVYGTILKNKFPNLVLVPSGSKDLITSFSSIMTSVLERTIWGVEFFMLCDRDAIPLFASTQPLEEAGKGRLKILNRYHLENYFLDENILAGIFATMEPAGSWLRNPEQIQTKLKELARPMVSYTAALIEATNYRRLVGNLSIMPKACHDKSGEDLAKLMRERANAEKVRINSVIDEGSLETSVKETFEKLKHSLDDNNDSWKQVIPGKKLFNKFAKETRLDSGRLKTLYLREAEKYSPNPFTDIISIFEQFSLM